MCQFKSAIVLRDESAKGGFKLLLSPWTESHSELCTIFKLNDTATARLYFARVEFSPPSMETAHQVETYKLRIDEERTPEWFSDEIRELVTLKLAAYIKSIIVTGNVALLIGGQFILAGSAKIECAKACVITAMLESSNVGLMLESSNVGEMWESSNVGEMWESSKVGEMWESSNVGEMWGSSNVGLMRGSSNVGEMWGSSKVGEMWGASNVGLMRGSSNVGVMRESSKVGENHTTNKTK